MGDDPPHGRSPGGVSTQGIQTYHWEVTKVAGGWELVIPTAGDGNAGGGFQGYGIVCSEESIPRMSRVFFKAVVQEVLIFGS